MSKTTLAMHLRALQLGDPTTGPIKEAAFTFEGRINARIFHVRGVDGGATANLTGDVPRVGPHPDPPPPENGVHGQRYMLAGRPVKQARVIDGRQKKTKQSEVKLVTSTYHHVAHRKQTSIFFREWFAISYVMR